MFHFSSVPIIIISVLCFLLGYAYLKDKAKGITMWSFSGKFNDVSDLEGFKKQQGKNAILLGITFLLFPILLLLFVLNYDMNKEVLSLWILVFAGVVT